MTMIAEEKIDTGALEWTLLPPDERQVKEWEARAKMRPDTSLFLASALPDGVKVELQGAMVPDAEQAKTYATFDDAFAAAEKYFSSWTVAAPSDVMDIPVDSIDPSPWQMRKVFSPEAMGQLRDSLTKSGQLTDARVRPMVDRYELIAGERRLRASKMAERATLRCRVVNLTDSEAREQVLIEQLQHEKWLPSEEAQGYHDLLELRDEKGLRMYTVERIAQTVSKSGTYVTEMLALMEVTAEVRKAVDENRLARRSASYLAMVVDPEKNKLAVQMVLHPAHKVDPLSVKETEELINEKFVRRLHKTPFKLADKKLVPEIQKDGERVGGLDCVSCPMRSGNSALMEGRLYVPASAGAAAKRGALHDICMNTECYALKCAAVKDRVIAEARKRGCEVMPEAEAAKIYDAVTGELLEACGYVALDDKPDPTMFGHFNPEKVDTWRKLLKAAKAKVQVWLACHPDTGDFQELVKWETAAQVVTGAVIPEPVVLAPVLEAGESIAIVERTPEPMWDTEAAREVAVEARIEKRDETKQVLEAVRTLQKGLVNVDERAMWMLLIEHLLPLLTGADGTALLVKALNLPEEEADKEHLLDFFRDWLEKSSLREVRGFVVLCMAGRCFAQWGMGWTRLEAWMELVGGEGEVAKLPSGEDAKVNEDVAKLPISEEEKNNAVAAAERIFGVLGRIHSGSAAGRESSEEKTDEAQPVPTAEVVEAPKKRGRKKKDAAV